MLDPTLETAVETWLRFDKNEATRAEVKSLVDSGNVKELQLRMGKRIAFGTSGLRAKMEAGWARMNDLTVIQASQGLCTYVLKTVANAAQKGVVIGYDHRHHSERWASLAATAFITKGVKVYLLRGLSCTPLVPFSVSHTKAACGVMITASHNPKQDNGYKVYWENAVQIISPHDKGIAAAIKENLEPWTWDVSVLSSNPLCIDNTAELHQEYFASIAKLSLHRDTNPSCAVKFVSTPMHGVGHQYAVRAFEVFALPPFVSVKSQEVPDPEFPTVNFPNPEEKGALDLAMKEAEAVGATYVLAQDPDADRFAAAERRKDGQWIAFTGDQLGTLFAAHCLERYKASGKPLNQLAMVATTVSSKMVESMAEKEGFKFVECLTGFKYIGNKALDLEAEGYDVTFAYEEAIGFMIGSTIRDKDGIAATAYFAELAAALDHKGLRVSDHLKTLYEKYGYFKTSNSYFRCTEPPTIDKIFARLRKFNGQSTNDRPDYPPSIGGLKITNVRDLTVGYDSGNPPTYKPTMPLSSGHMIQFRAYSEVEGVKISLTIRTSGTEPKIKYYLEGSGPDRTKVETTLPKVVEDLTNAWMEAELNQLGIP